MDPFAAAAFAGNVVQFVDFAAKVVSGSRALYISVNGVKAENVEVEQLAQHLRSLVQQTKFSDSTPWLTLPEEQKANVAVLKDLGNQCVQIASDLIFALEGLKIKGTHRGWESIYRSLKSEWKKGQIVALKERLESVSRQLRDHMLAHQQGHILQKLESLREENRRLAASRNEELAVLAKTFNKFVRELAEMKKESEKKERRKLEAEVRKARRKTHQKKHGTKRNQSNILETSDSEVELDPVVEDAVWMPLSDLTTKVKQYSAEQVVLHFLRFDTMDDRSILITRAHRNTFGWAYKSAEDSDSIRPSTRFVEWLQSDSPIYWVSGKPGSGKSTFMKFLSREQRTRSLLQAWAGSYHLATADYFFWVSAKDPLQKSQEGLLRCILYQIFRTCPDLIGIALADQWALLKSNDNSSRSALTSMATVPQLLEMLRKMYANIETFRAKFFFFIDGLDEFDGKPADIINFINLIKGSSNVKLCVASRSWNEFEDAFGRDNPWKLYIHQLNEPDIRTFVSDELEKDIRFRQLREHDERCPDFTKEIVDTAQGVFLWVSLVIRSLLEGLTNADRISDLQRRFRELPTDLYEFFERMIHTINPFYLDESVRMLWIALQAYRPLPLTTYWFIDQDDQKYVREVEIEELPSKKAAFRCYQMKRRLGALCRGLIDSAWEENATSVLHQRVDFLHRTVRDYMERPEMKSYIQERTPPTLQVDLVICEAILAQVKTAPRSVDWFAVNGEIHRLSLVFFHHFEMLNDAQLPGSPELDLVTDFYKSLRVIRLQRDVADESVFDKIVAEWPRLDKIGSESDHTAHGRMQREASLRAMQEAEEAVSHLSVSSRPRAQPAKTPRMRR